MEEPWYTVANVSEVDSPALLIYPDRVQENINRLIASIDSTDRLRPHVKTHKSPEVTRMMLASGIKKVKCSTIAEAEMLAEEQMPDVLLAYQPVGPRAERLVSLIKKFPRTNFSCLVDNKDTAQELSLVFANSKRKIPVYIDLNVGMNRTGISPGAAFQLFEDSKGLQGLEVIGLHAYDGHLRDVDIAVRTKRCDEGFQQIENLQDKIEKSFDKKLIIVAGGTPTFSIHSKRKEIECSPGTYIYWDKGYETILKEQHYLHAALVLTRVISIPAEGTICVDLGHKAIASENPIANRVYFLNAPELEPIGHSEEHMVFKTSVSKPFRVGDVLYGVPYHVCPTVALHDVAHAVRDRRVIEKWQTTARKRTLTI